MNANDLTFGIEIETIAPDSAVRNDGLRIGPYKHGIQVPYLPAGWTAEARRLDRQQQRRPQVRDRQPDPSRAQKASPRSPRCCERSKPKATGSTRAAGSTSTSAGNATGPAEALARLVTIVAYVEKGLYAITGTKSRERGTYCGGVRKYGNDKDAKPNLDRNRYHALNLTNLARGTKDTVEFRVFSGSLNADEGGRMDSGLPGLGRAGHRTASGMPNWEPETA